MDTYEAIRTLRSIREFDTKHVPDEVITRILKAGRWTGSSKNTQPWQFIVIKDQERLDRLAGFGQYADHLRRANFAIVLVTEAERRADFDAGRCCQNMMLAAWNDGVGSCIASMHRDAEAKNFLGIPADYKLQQAISFGYPAAAAAPSPWGKQGGRKPMDTLVHQERW